VIIPVRRVRWQPCRRILPSRFPPRNLFDRIADPADLEAVIAVESLTDDRLRDEIGEIRLVSPAERIVGPGSGVIMAAFTHLNPAGSRFSDGSYGVFHAARTLAGAIAETCHHRERFMAATRQPRMELDMRVYAVDLDARLHDLRGLRAQLPEVHDPESYAASQALARRLRAEGSSGIAHDSVRAAGEPCAAVFRPRALSNCGQDRHLTYVWDGAAIVEVYEKRAFGAG
jgi:hypothetical protein